MTDKKYCYRYVDGNDSEGRPIVMLWVRVILRETEKTFWHCHDYPRMTLAELTQYNSRPNNRDVKRSLKGAARSKYHMTREDALKAFIYRKVHQLSRINLTVETVRLCLQGLYDSGFVERSMDGGVNQFSNVLKAPKSHFTAADEAGPIASTYSWGDEY